MQPCFRHTRYVSPGFQPTLQTCLRLRSCRTYRNGSKSNSVPNRASETSRFGSKDVESQEKNKHRYPDVTPKSNRLTRFRRVEIGKESSEKDFGKNVERALAAVTDLWAENGSNGDGQRDWVTQLTPDRAKWEEFEDIVKQSLDTQGADFSSSKKSDLEHGPIQDLITALRKVGGKQKWMAEMTRILKFAYVDNVMQSEESLRNGGKADLLDLRYPTEWYPETRCLQRHVHLHVGPTNSGKTYNALKRLEESGNGFFAGPLRLLAHEVYSRFNSRGIASDLITGDDVRLQDDAVGLSCSTVEMVDIGRHCDVGVIDEIQMIGSPDRGWAWTRALLGAQAKELHLCGEARVVPLIRELVASMGDTLHIHQYERLNPLKVMSRSLKGSLKNLRRGDCVVSFSVMGIHALKRQIELETNRRCAIVYGSLPPETRAQQAALFNDPDNDYDFLVASDAVGMGLNLSIKRVIFEKTVKYNGSFLERLTIPQLKQIAGRAGRYRTSNDDKSKLDAEDPKWKKKTSVGLVTCLDEADLPFIQRALATEAPPIKAAGLLPTGEVYERAAQVWPQNLPFEYIMRRIERIVSLNKRFELCNTNDQFEIARAIDSVPNLTVRERLLICAAPATLKGRSGDEAIVAFAKLLALKRTVNVCDVPEIPLEVLDEPMSPSQGYLDELEKLHKILNLYLWLHYRFPGVFGSADMAKRAKELTEEKINACLVIYSANPRLRDRLQKIREASALLREQMGEEFEPEDIQPTMNPDASLEEVERRAREEEDDRAISDFIRGEEGNDYDVRPFDKAETKHEWTIADQPPPEQKVADELSKW